MPLAVAVALRLQALDDPRLRAAGLGRWRCLPICLRGFCGRHSLFRVDGRESRRDAYPARMARASSSLAAAAAGTKLIARSASAVIVRLGLTPTLAGTTDPSQTSRFS